MDILPPALENCIHRFRPLLRAEVLDTFYYLLVSLLIGEAKFGTVRAVSSPRPIISRRASRISSPRTASRRRR